MSSNTEFDWLVAEICDTKILDNGLQNFVRGAQCE